MDFTSEALTPIPFSRMFLLQFDDLDFCESAGAAAFGLVNRTLSNGRR